MTKAQELTQKIIKGAHEGDLIKVIRAKNSQGASANGIKDGDVVTVAAGIVPNKSRTSLMVTSESGMAYTLYGTAPYDILDYASRKDKLGSIEGRIKHLREEIKELEVEVTRLEKFASDEEEAAYKIDNLLELHAKEPDKARRVELITELIKTTSKTNYL
jgi:hypothetical protein